MALLSDIGYLERNKTELFSLDELVGVVLAGSLFGVTRSSTIYIIECSSFVAFLNKLDRDKITNGSLDGNGLLEALSTSISKRCKKHLNHGSSGNLILLV